MFRRYQSRAFLLLPMTFNVSAAQKMLPRIYFRLHPITRRLTQRPAQIGVIIGPILGGLLSDPAGSYPDAFGKVAFFKHFPYALPNLVSACFLSLALLGIWLFLEEVSLPLHIAGPDSALLTLYRHMKVFKTGSI
jgi:hypothetical protein